MLALSWFFNLVAAKALYGFAIRIFTIWHGAEVVVDKLPTSNVIGYAQIDWIMTYRELSRQAARCADIHVSTLLNFRDACLFGVHAGR
jgi:hypothetical protein